jgi:hypothetical protein
VKRGSFREIDTTDSVHVFLLESVHLFSLELNAESAQKALRPLLGHMMCVADWLLPGRHNHQEGTTACDCTWIGGER